jgi:hypothetical protein
VHKDNIVISAALRWQERFRNCTVGVAFIRKFIHGDVHPLHVRRCSFVSMLIAFSVYMGLYMVQVQSAAPVSLKLA